MRVLRTVAEGDGVDRAEGGVAVQLCPAVFNGRAVLICPAQKGIAVDLRALRERDLLAGLRAELLRLAHGGVAPGGIADGRFRRRLRLGGSLGLYRHIGTGEKEQQAQRDHRKKKDAGRDAPEKELPPFCGLPGRSMTVFDGIRIILH